MLRFSFDEINDKFYRIVMQMGPFGPGNMQPVFMSTDVSATKNTKIVGENHLKLELTQDGMKTINAIAFRLGEMYDHIKDGTPFAICYTVEENEFRGIKSLQLVIKDIKLSI